MQAQIAQLLDPLDALRHHGQLQAVRQGDHRRGDGGAISVQVNVPDKRPVELQRDDGKAPQIFELAIAGAEIVDRDPHAHTAKLLERFDGGFHIVQHHAFGQLQLE